MVSPLEEVVPKFRRHKAGGYNLYRHTIRIILERNKKKQKETYAASSLEVECNLFICYFFSEKFL